MSLGRCTSCGAGVTWGVVVTSGKRMPINPEPADDGNVVIESWAADGTARLRVLKKVDVDGYAGGLYKSHFATCPNAARHRR